MKVHFDNVAQFGTGPGSFANRLARQFFETGHEVVFSNEGADISLVFIERSGAPLAKRVAQRLDGIWFKPSEFHTKNVGILDLFMKTDGVVFQSEFDKHMVTHWWNRHRQPPAYVSTVIGNGIKLDPVKELTIPAIVDLRKQYKRMYVCSSNWHPQKRLGANIRLFQQLQKHEPSSCLIVMGSNPDVVVPGPHVFYTGPVGPDVYNQIYSAADWMIHLAWADHCPNVVVEALAQGTPVVCADVGGTKELIGRGAYGLVLQEPLYNFMLTDYDNPPDIDVSQVTSLPTRHALDYSNIPDRINIEKVAQQYIQLFETLIRQ